MPNICNAKKANSYFYLNLKLLIILKSLILESISQNYYISMRESSTPKITNTRLN